VSESLRLFVRRKAEGYGTELPKRTMGKKQKKSKRQKAKPGPKAETLKIKGDWHKAIQKSLSKKKPSEGWPE